MNMFCFGIGGFRNLIDLLFNINENTTIKLMQQANVAACDKMTEQIHYQNSSISVASGGDSLLINESEKREVIEDLDLMGFKKSLIERAIRNLKTTDRDKLMEYCTKHEMDNTIDMENFERFDNIRSELIRDTTQDSLEEKLSHIGIKFKEMLNNSIIK